MTRISGRVYWGVLGLCSSLFYTSASQADSPLDIPLNALQDEIKWLQEEVYVTTATKTREAVSKSGSSMSVITAEDLRAMGARTLLDALKRLPGLGISDVNAGMTSLEVRGVKTDFAEKVLFLINGHSINNNLANGGASTSYNTFIVDDIRRVEVVRGPGSALYGANAFVAVVNIVTKTADDVQGVEVTAKGGSHDTGVVNVQLGQHFDDAKFAMNLHYFDTNGLNERVESDAIGQSSRVDYSERRYEAGLNFTKGSFFLQGKYLRREAGNFFSITNIINDDSEQEYIDYFLEGGFKKSLSSSTSVEIKAYTDHFEFDNTWEQFPEGYSNPGGSCPTLISCPDGLKIRTPVKQDMVGAEAQISYDWSLSQKWLMGVMYEHQSQYDVELWSNGGQGELQNISSVANWNDSQNRDISAIYLQNIWDIRDDLRLIAGGRYDHYSDFGGTLNPRASLTWSWRPQMRFLVSYGSAFRAPTFSELFNSNNSGIVGDNSLDPEEIETLEMGVLGDFTRRSSYRISWFRNSIDDLIAPIATNTAVNTSANVGKLKVEGVEVEVSHRFNDGSTVAMNYTYQHPINQLSHEREADVPLHRANLNYQYHVSRNIGVFTGLLYKGETIREDGDNRSNVDDYVTVDLAVVAKEVWLKNLELRASIYNLLNKEYEDPAPNVMLSDYPKDDRNFMVEATYLFD
ncbi:TonB-dependent receptor plug domain-containing protein [Litoribrevibacter euphylliae]|uniref:TonB-dependent receptor plug domain-containing protein n=1 Tax=Litoribrevibacter euphylliae TaxID=1834034 RepID=A0ABV7HDV8_9GAMM